MKDKSKHYTPINFQVIKNKKNSSFQAISAKNTLHDFSNIFNSKVIQKIFKLFLFIKTQYKILTKLYKTSVTFSRLNKNKHKYKNSFVRIREF